MGSGKYAFQLLWGRLNEASPRGSLIHRINGGDSDSVPTGVQLSEAPLLEARLHCDISAISRWLMISCFAYI